MAKIIITIPNEKIAEFQKAFLASNPPPQNMITGKSMPIKQWIEEWTRLQLRRAYISGCTLLASKTATIDDSILAPIL